MKNILKWFACLSLFALTAAADTVPVLVFSVSQTSYTRTLGGNPVEFQVSATGTPVPDLSLSAPADLNVGEDYEFDSASGMFSFYPDKIGTFEFTFTAVNSAGSASKTVTITVPDPNAPVLSVPAISYFTYVGASNIAFNVTATGTPAPNLILSSVDAAPGSYTFAQDTGHFDFSPIAAGTNTFDFTATNDAGTASKTVTIVVSPRSAPVISLPKESYAFAQTNKSFELFITAQGMPSPDLVLASSTANPENYDFFPGPGILEFWAAELGTFAFTFTATNSEGSDSKTLLIFVVRTDETGYFPSWSQVPVQYLAFGETLAFQPAGYVQGTNPVPFVKLISSTASPSDYSFDNETLVFQPSEPGSFTFTFSAVGLNSYEATKTLQVEVSPPVTVSTLAVSNVTDTSATASWTACDGVSSYTLQLATDDQFTPDSTHELLHFDNLGDPSDPPSDWTYNLSDSSGNILQLLSAADYVVSETVDASACTVLELSLRVQTLNGSANNSNRLLVQYSADDGANWTDIGYVTGSSSAIPKAIDVSAAAGQSSVRFRFSAPYAASGKGVGLSRISLTGTAPVHGSLVESIAVDGLSHDFAGLAPSTTYYARVKGEAGWSTVVQFTTRAVTVPVLTVSDVAATTALASWTPCDGVSSYTLQLASDDQFTPDSTQERLLFDNPGNPADPPSDWTYDLSDSGGNLLQLLSAANCVVSETVDASACTALELSLKVQTLNGSTNNSNRLLVQYSADDGANWTDIGNITGSAAAIPKSIDVSAAAGQSSVRFRFSAPYAASGKGVALSHISLTGTAPVHGSLVESTAVDGLSHAFAGLAPSTAYYARVKGDAAWSSVVPFTTSDSSPATETLEIVFHDQTAAATHFTLQGTIPGHSYQLFWTTNLLSGFTAQPIGQATNATMLVPFPSTNAWFAYPSPASVTP